MKRNNTYVLFDSDATVNRRGWAEAHDAISRALQSMRWPDREGVERFTISRIVTIRAGQGYTNFKGKLVTVKKEAITLRNGVRPLRDQFRRWMAGQHCSCEASLSLAPFFQKLREGNAGVFRSTPHLTQPNWRKQRMRRSMRASATSTFGSKRTRGSPLRSSGKQGIFPHRIDHLTSCAWP